MIETKSNLLVFDKPDKNGHIFPKECVVNIPAVVPVTHPNKESSIGMVTSHNRDGSRIEILTRINCPDVEIIKKAIEKGDVYSGGYYKINKTHYENGIEVIDDITLKSVGLYLSDVFGDNDLKMEVINDEQHN